MLGRLHVDVCCFGLAEGEGGCCPVAGSTLTQIDVCSDGMAASAREEGRKDGIGLDGKGRDSLIPEVTASWERGLVCVYSR